MIEIKRSKDSLIGTSHPRCYGYVQSVWRWNKSGRPVPRPDLVCSSLWWDRRIGQLRENELKPEVLQITKDASGSGTRSIVCLNCWQIRRFSGQKFKSSSARFTRKKDGGHQRWSGYHEFQSRTPLSRREIDEDRYILHLNILWWDQYAVF